MAFVLSAEREREMSEILTRYPTRRAACIPVLHLCQDQEGYVSEEAMSYVADKLGDPTARYAGRLTLNPIPHIDIVGSIILPIFCALTPGGFFFGWAKEASSRIFVGSPRATA